MKDATKGDFLAAINARGGAMVLITKAIMAKLLANHGADNPRPPLKLFTPDGGATWLISDINPERPSMAFGLCDLGIGSPELGYVDLDEIATARGQFGLPIERDRWFSPTKTLAEYADAARAAGRIVA